MPSLQPGNFPTMQVVMDLARSFCNDMYPGRNGQNGRVLTNDAPFTLPLFNSALRTLQRKLREEGVTFPIVDNFILQNVTALAQADPSIQVYVGFDGYFDGTIVHPTPRLPIDCLQVLSVMEQTVGSNLPFCPLTQSQGGLLSTFQGSWLGVWEWRQYRIYMVGSLLNKNLRLRYQSGAAPLNPNSPADFATTQVGILDCEEAMAYLISENFANPRGGDSTFVGTKAQEAIDDMANEWVRRGQEITYRRPSYNGGGSSDTGTPLGPTGQTGSGG